MDKVAEVDVLILGGGINGCGSFRDLCAQGIDCLLLERTDFCAGASAGFSRLMHGGLKYLETGEFRLVRESAEERYRLLANAAHYVTPLPTVLPLRSRFGGILPSVLRFFRLEARLRDRGSLITRLGLTLYDFYGRNSRAMPTRVSESRVGVLLSRYGTRAARIAPELGADRALGSLPAYSREELSWLIGNERVGGIDDLLRRRTDIAISGSLTEAGREEVSSLFEASRSAVA